MRTKTCAVLAAVCLALAGGAVAQPAARAAPHVGRSFLFDYGEMVIRVSYLSDKKLQWQQVKGPQAGLKGEEEYGSSEVRPNVVFLWWQEKDTSIVTQVVDFEKKVVHTTWMSPEKKLAAFQGRVTPRN